MSGVAQQIQAIDVEIPALLLDHEHLRTQLQNGVQLFLAQGGMVFANPVDRHNAGSRKEINAGY
jgi:hypothetical protein